MKYDVIVVLAGGITNQETLPESVKKRILLAKKFYDQKASPRILMSGKWSKYWDYIPPQHTEAMLMRQYAVSLGLPKSSILIEEHSQNTFENAFYVSKLFLEPRLWKKVLVVTSDFHINRAQYIFKQVLKNTCALDFVGSHGNESCLRKLQLTVKEFVLLHTQRLLQYVLNRC